jgi:ABC-type glycerol-3-phosphate transport system permease component
VPRDLSTTSSFTPQLGTVLRFLVGFLLLLVVLVPFYFVFTGAFKTNRELISPVPTFWPNEFVFKNFTKLFTISKYPTYLVNSLIVASLSTVINVLLVTLASYSIYRCRYRGRLVIFAALIGVYVFPAVVLLVPIYQMLGALGLIDSILGLVVVNVTFAAPFSLWLMGPFFDSVPRSVEEAAALDGAGRLKVLFKVILPMVAPGIGTIAVYSFISSWTEYAFANILIFSEANKTLPVGLARFITQYFTDWGMLNAGAAITALPAFVGRYFVDSITGSIK